MKNKRTRRRNNKKKKNKKVKPRGTRKIMKGGEGAYSTVMDLMYNCWKCVDNGEWQDIYGCKDPSQQGNCTGWNLPGLNLWTHLADNSKGANEQTKLATGKGKTITNAKMLKIKGKMMGLMDD